MSNSNLNLSIARIETSLEMLSDLQAATSELIQGYMTCRKVSEDLKKEDLFSVEVMSELENMFIAINRLNYMEEARLKQLQMMRQCEIATEKLVQAQKEAANARLAARRATAELALTSPSTL